MTTMSMAPIWLVSALVTGVLAVALSSSCDASEVRGLVSVGLCVLAGAFAGLAADPTRGSVLRIAIFVVVTPVVGVFVFFLVFIASVESCG
jgi:hypothetical protein